jgi:hypothetical protein
VTEGILLRRLQQDPSLEGVGALLLDEFHERSLDADTALALALDCQAWTRPDLRCVCVYVCGSHFGGGREVCVFLAPACTAFRVACSTRSKLPINLSAGLGMQLPLLTNPCLACATRNCAGWW